MDVGIADRPGLAERRAALLRGVGGIGARIASMAGDRDADASFPAEELELLRCTGVLLAPVPVAFGGLGLGTQPDAVAGCVELLRAVGLYSLPLGRVFEGHVNALRLVFRLGTPAQAEAAAADAAQGHLFGVWNTDPADAVLTYTGERLAGAKILASGAGTVTRAMVTAGTPRQLFLVSLEPGSSADLRGWTAQGMRASATGRVDFDDVPPGAIALIGAPDAYLAQPDFSGGAWRVLAVQLGGLDALMAELRGFLRARGRDGDPHQRARVGTALIAQESAGLFVRRAAALAEDPAAAPETVVAYVGLARIAVETACLDAMRLAQRSIGLSAFMRPAPIERICRDLATYLRQPVPDEALTEAAAWFMDHALP